jgi:hypothetical protein
MALRLYKSICLTYLIGMLLGAFNVSAQRRGWVYRNDPNDDGILEVQLQRLSGEGRSLDGQFVRVVNVELSPDYLPTSLNPLTQDFRFAPHSEDPTRCSSFVRSDHDCSYFDDVNVYEHIDRFAQQYWINFLKVPIFFKVTAFTHLDGDSGLAYPDRMQLLFTHGTTLGKDAATEDDTIYHEYTHIVLAQLGLSASSESSTEHKALHEGYADYFAASFTNDPLIGEWEYDCPPRYECTGAPNDISIRTLSTAANRWNWQNGRPNLDLNYGLCVRKNLSDGKCKTTYFTHTEPYVWGMIWAGALWDMRMGLGASVADPLVVEGIRLVHTGNVSFEDAYKGLLLADLKLYGGIHRDVIQSVFQRRGIGLFYTPNEQDEIPMTHLDLYPNPANESVMVLTSPEYQAKIRVWNVLGQQVWAETSSVSQWILDTKTWASGTYWVEWQGKSGRETQLLKVVH